MGALFSNNASSSLASSISTSATTLSVDLGGGDKFPNLEAGGWFMATLTKLVGAEPVHEVVKVTARAGDVLTVARAQEGTTAQTFAAGDKIDQRITAAGLNSKMDKDGGAFTGDVAHGDHLVTQAVLADCGLAFKDMLAVNTLDYRNGQMQRWAPATGPQTLAVTNWPPDGVLGMLMIEGVNLGAATITGPAIDWIKSDGTFATTTSLNTNHGATLQASGTDFIILWTRNAGAKLYGKVVR